MYECESQRDDFRAHGAVSVNATPETHPHLAPTQLARDLPALVRANGAVQARLALPPFVLRSSVPDDVAPLAALLRAGYTHGLRGAYRDNVLAAALPIISRPKDSLIYSGSYFVADCGAGQLLAAGGWSWQGPVGGVAPRNTAHIRHMVVSPEATGRGIGRLVLEHTITSARAQGVARLICTSTTTAQGFYEACGFTLRSEVELSLGGGLHFPAVQLQMEI